MRNMEEDFKSLFGWELVLFNLYILFCRHNTITILSF